jgi:hypothetical protein
VDVTFGTAGIAKSYFLQELVLIALEEDTCFWLGVGHVL